MTTLTPTQINSLQSRIDSDDVAGFYADLDGYGDSYGRLGGAVTNNGTWQGRLANGFAESAAEDNNVDMSYGSAAWTALNKNLAGAYLQAYRDNSNSTPAWDDVQTLHNDAYINASLDPNDWFPNKMLNESDDPAALWDDWQNNTNMVDVIEDALDVARAGLFTPFEAMRMDSQEWMDSINFGKDFLGALFNMGETFLQEMAIDLVASAAISALLNLIEDLTGQGFDNPFGGGGDGWFPPDLDWPIFPRIPLPPFPIGGGGGWPERWDTPWGILSPLAIDLDFDGVELVSLANGTHVWDIDNDGLGESTGWVGADDGLLAIDLNEDGVINNHAELFGTATTDGFTILSGYDSNGDGVIDASDADFSSLLIWRDANQNGYSESTEIQTLSEWGIVSIALGATEVSYSLEGNPVTHESTVTWSNTAQSDVVDAWFVTDQFNSTFVGDWTPDVRVAFLPTLRGYGDLPDLHIAMSLDNTGTGNLLDRVKDLALLTDMTDFFDGTADAMMTQILYRWAGVDPSLAANARGVYLEDAKHLEFLEELFGENFIQQGYHTNPAADASRLLESLWQDVFNTFRAHLFVQTAAGEVFETTPVYSPYTGTFAGDFDLSAAGITALKDAALGLDSGARDAFWINVAEYISFSKGDVTDLTELGWLDDAVADSFAPGFAEWADIVDFLDTIDDPLVTQGDDNANTLTGGSGADQISALGGNDTVSGAGGDDTLYGGSGNDILYGGDGNDTLSGDSGMDTLDGGAGGDTLRGGADSDLYVFSSGDDAIDDTGGAADMIAMPSGITISDLTLYRTGLDDLNIVVGSLGSIFIDDHFDPYVSSHRIETVQFADLSTLNLLTLDNILYYGSPSGDTVFGTAVGGNKVDVMYGYAGNDDLRSGDGNDIVYGGDDHDYIDGDDGNDTLYGDSGNDKIYGGVGADTVYGGDGNDKIYGEDDADILDGGAGNDTISGGSGNDTITDFYDDNNITGGSGMDVIDTGDGNNVIDAGADDDDVDAGNGNNTVYGGSGVDILRTGTGVDYIHGGSGNDTVYAGDGNDTVFEEDAISGNDTIYGEGGNDTLTAGDGNDTVYGGAGDDLIYGRAHVDLLYGGDDNDTIYGGSSGDTLYGDNGDDHLYGESGVDALYGGNGNDYLDGGSSDDVVQGGAGNDEYLFGVGSNNDVLTDISGIDQITFASGTMPEQVTFVNNGTYNVLIDLTNTFSDDLTVVGHRDTSTTQQVEWLVFADGFKATFDNYATWITGTSSAQTLNGDAGGVTRNDTIWGRAGNDVINGANGNDYISGDAGNDTLHGDAGDDWLHGGSGTDTLHGDAGTDNLWGGTGADTFMFDVASSFSNVDVIRDFKVSDNDKLDVSSLLVGYDPLNEAITDFIQITEGGGNSALFVDRDGLDSAYGFEQIASLTGVTGLTDEAALVSSGHILV